MLKPSLLYLFLSILIVIFARYAHLMLLYIQMLYAYLNIHLTPFFTQLGLGPISLKITLLVLIPVLMAAIPALLYRIIRRKEMPYFLELTWCLWLVIVISNTLIRF